MFHQEENLLSKTLNTLILTHKHLTALLLLIVGVITSSNINAQSKLSVGLKKIFVRGYNGTPKSVSFNNGNTERQRATYNISYAQVPGTIEELFPLEQTPAQNINEEVKFNNFTDMPEEYDIWDNVNINPYNVSLTDMKDTIAIDVSGYCPPSQKHVTSNWGFRKWRYHYGIDLKVHRGDTVKCAFDGVVRIIRYQRRGYGHYVMVRHDNGLETLYAHLEKPLVKSGDRIKAGDAIGKGGNTGRSTGYHLHLEFRYLGNPINPNDVVDFSTHTVKKNILVLSAETFAYKKEIDKIRYWTIKKGDTLGRIASRTGVSVSKLCKLNGIKPNTILRIGRRIRYT